MAKRWIKKPVQPDSVSCGVLVFTAVYSVLSNPSEYKASFIDLERLGSDGVRVMRLRILWLLVCATMIEHGAPPNARYKEILKHLVDSLPHGALAG